MLVSEEIVRATHPKGLGSEFGLDIKTCLRNLLFLRHAVSGALHVPITHFKAVLCTRRINHVLFANNIVTSALQTWSNKGANSSFFLFFWLFYFNSPRKTKKVDQL